MAFLVHGVGAGRRGTTVDGGAARGVGNHHTIAEQLGYQLHIGGLAAARAGAGELKQGLQGLAVLHAGLVGDPVGHLGHSHGELPVLLFLTLGIQGLHHQGLGLGGAHLHAVAAAGAVQGADLHAVQHAGKLLTGGLLGYVAGGHLSAFLHVDGPDASMGANQRAGAALHAVLGNPLRHLHGNAALLELGGAGGNHAAGIHGAHGQLVAFLRQDGMHEGIKVLGGALHLGSLGAGGGISPLRGYLDFLQAGNGDVDGVPVLLDNRVALLAVGLLGIGLHVLVGLLVGNHVRQLEEGSLHNGVDAVAHAHLRRQVDGVDDVQPGMLLGQHLLHGSGQVLLQLVGLPLAVEQEHAAVLQRGHHVVHGHISGVVASHEVRRVDLIGGLDGRLAKAQVAYRQAAGLLGVVGKVGLRIHVGVVTDDLDGVLVGANGTVGAQAVELAADGAFGSGVEQLAHGQAGAGHVLHNAHGEVVLHFAVQVGEHSLHMGGGELLGAQAIAAAHHLDVVAAGLGEGSAHIQVERLAQRAGFLGAVQHGDLLAGRGDSRDEVLHGEGTVQVALDHAHLFAHGNHLGHGFVGHVAAGTHGDDNLFRVGSAHIIEQVIVAAGQLAHLRHGLLDNLGHSQVILVASLTALEINVGVLGGTGLMGMIGVQAAGAELFHLVPGNQLGDLVVLGRVDLLDLVAGTEAVKEVEEGHGALQGSQMGHQRHVAGFLHGVAGQHGEAGLTAGHNVAVVTEDGQRVIGQGAGAHVEHRGGQLTGDLIHVGDHQQQALGGGEGGGQGTGGQRAVHSAGRTGLGLHFCDSHGLSEQIFAILGGPLIGHFRHGGRRRDGVNGCHIAERISDMADGSITVNGHFECHGCTSLTISGLSRPSRKTLGVAASFSKTRQKTREILEHINYKRSRKKCQFCPREFPSFSGRVCQRKRHGSCVRMTFAQSR